VAKLAPPAAASPTGEPRHRAYGEDGIFGLPGWPWRADDTAATTTFAPTRYVFNWLGRYWPGPGQKLTR
jgi:hypothetical protein